MSDRQYEYPKLRWPLDVQFQEAQGKRILILSCPLGITEQPLGLHAAVAPLLQEFQGKLSLSEIEERFRTQGCTRELLEGLVQLLDNHLFLETPKFLERNELVRREFLAAPERPAYLAGLGYPGTAAELNLELDGHLKNGAVMAVEPPKQRMLGLMSPHIDYRRGGVCYGITWNQIRGHEHDLYIVMGTSHQYSEYMFHLSGKDFACPLGALKCDRSFIEAVATRYGPIRSFSDEYLHRREHSLELQLPFLRKQTKAPVIAPILVGSFYQMLRSQKLPYDFPIYEDFISALAEVTLSRLNQGSRVCIVAGVDMAHIGRQFGDTFDLSPELMAEIERRDREYLAALTSQDKLALWTHLASDMDKRRICGFPTMYTVLDLFDRLGLRYDARLYDYRQAADYRTQCAVTFAGLGMYQR